MVQDLTQYTGSKQAVHRPSAPTLVLLPIGLGPALSQIPRVPPWLDLSSRVYACLESLITYNFWSYLIYICIYIYINYNLYYHLLLYLLSIYLYYLYCSNLFVFNLLEFPSTECAPRRQRIAKAVLIFPSAVHAWAPTVPPVAQLQNVQKPGLIRIDSTSLSSTMTFTLHSHYIFIH